MKKGLLIALIPLIILMLIASGVLYVTGKTDEVKFADPNVESDVRAAIGKSSGTIHEDDVEDITWLKISAKDRDEVIDLSGLEHLSKLDRLEIYNCCVTDFSPLSTLANLKSVGFTSCKVEHFSALSDLPHLDSLSLLWVGLSDNALSELSVIPGLMHLSICGIELRDLSPLSGLTNLVSLRLQDNMISDISPISSLVNLRDLFITGNQVSDITPLATLNRLLNLGLSGNQISNIDALSSMSELDYLDLKDNDIADLSPIADGNGPISQSLNIEGNPLSDRSIEVYIPQIEGRGITVVY
jgi:Leucine-rich repeat (LRR) protein